MKRVTATPLPFAAHTDDPVVVLNTLIAAVNELREQLTKVEERFAWELRGEL